MVPNNNSGQLSKDVETTEMNSSALSASHVEDDDDNGPYHSLPPADHIKETQFPYVSMETSNDDWKESSSLDDNVSLMSALTADEISDKPGFYIVSLVVLIGDMSRGVMFPTLWPLVQSLGGTEVTQGYAVAAFSFGRILSSPIFGSWSVTWGYAKTLMTSVFVLLIGTLLYAQAGNVGNPNFLILAQIVMGIGSGTLGVTRAFVADVTPHRNRTTYLSWLTAVQYGGFTVTPFFGALFSKFFENGDNTINKGFFVLNAFTAPAYFMFIIGIITFFLLLFVFEDRHMESNTPSKKKKKANPETEQLANAPMKYLSFLTVYDATLIGCMLLNVASKGSIAVFETLGITIAESHFNLLSSQAGSIVGTCGTLGVISLLSMEHIAKYLNDIQMIAYGLLVMAGGVVSLADLKADVENPTWRYIIAIFLIYSIGYPIGHTALIGLFSKVVGRRKQGTLQGMFASAGSLARICFPITSGYLSHYAGSTVLFLLITGVLVTAVTYTLTNRKTLHILSS